jgi:mRNA interferase MazF
MKPGAVVLVRFPFTSLEQAKKRPALVLSHVRHSARIRLVTFAMITSKLDGLDLEGDVKLKEWEETGLLHPSLVRLSKLATIDVELIERELGAIGDSDRKDVTRAFRKLYREWVEK